MKVKKLSLLLLSTLCAFSVTSCKKDGGNSSSNKTSSSTVTPTEEDSQVWKDYDDAHVNQAYKGAKSTGSQGINLSGLSSQEKASLLGDTESWAMKNHLLGVPIFGNGSWTLINPRIKLPTNGTYVINYGFGTAREGKITSDLTADAEPNEAYRKYFHDGLSDGVTEGLNPFDSNNSLSSDFISQLSGSLYGQRLVKDGNGGYKAEYEWYSSMAESEPEPLNFDSETNTATKWRIKVRNDNNMVYHTLSDKSVKGTAISSFEGKKITAKDFVDSYQAMLNGMNKYSYAGQYVSRFVGGEAYNKATADKKVFSDADNTEFKKVGIKLIDDTTIEFEFKSTMTKFDVMMQLSLSPMNVDFYKLVTDYNGTFKPQNYGKNIEAFDLTPKDSLLSSGAYSLKTFDSGTGTDREIVLKRNDNFIDRVLENNDKYEVYAIEGYVYKINTAWKDDAGITMMYQEYLSNKLDTASIPSDQKSQWEGSKPGKYITGSTSTTQLQVNSTTVQRWQEVFGANGSNWKNQSSYTYDATKANAYQHKPVMSNMDFLDGIYFAIDRASLANDLMVTPSCDWLAEAYVMDISSNVSYSKTAAHARAMKDWSPKTYGYNRAVAQQKFKKAMDDLTTGGKYTRGTKENPKTVTINMQLAADSQKKNWGSKVEAFIEDAFNSANADYGYKLDVNILPAPTKTSDIYAILASGCYDLCWGGITGGTGDAFGMTGVYVDSFDYGLQMSVGVSTDADTGEGGIIHDGYSYSMHAIFLAVESGESVVVENGVYVPPQTPSTNGKE